MRGPLNKGPPNVPTSMNYAAPPLPQETILALTEEIGSCASSRHGGTAARPPLNYIYISLSLSLYIYIYIYIYVTSVAWLTL